MTELVTVPAAPVVPPFPALGDPNFNQLAYDNGSAMPGVSAGLQAIAVTAFTNATVAGEKAAEAAGQVALATAQANAAIAAANATAWVSGSIYAIGDTRYSPINLQPYRRRTVGAGAIDPSLDTVNWAALGGVSLAQLHATALSF